MTEKIYHREGAKSKKLGVQASSLAEILTPARFDFFGGEYLARFVHPIIAFFAVITGMFLLEELRSGLLAGRKSRLPEKIETQRRDFLMVAAPASPSPKLIIRELQQVTLLEGGLANFRNNKLASEEADERSMNGKNLKTRWGDG